MKRLVKGIVSGSVESPEEVIGMLLESPELLSDSELKLVRRLKSDKEDGGEYPSIFLLKEEFPDVLFGVEDEESLPDSKSARVYANRFLEDRRRIKVGKILFDLSESVQKHGLLLEDVESLRNYVKMDEDEKEDPTFFDFLQDIEVETSRPKGYMTFVDEIDDDIKAIDEAAMVSIFAFTSQYKTTFAQNICWKNAVLGKNTVYISLEVPKRMIWWKMVFSFAQQEQFRYHPTYWEVFTNHEWTEKNRPEVVEYLFSDIIPAFEKMKGKIIVYDETDFPEYTEAIFRRKIEDADDAVGGNLNGVIYDQASLLKFTDATRRNESYSGETINRFISFIRRMGNAFRKNPDGTWRRLTNIVLAQANRKSFLDVAKDKENLGRYSLTGIAEANEIERASSYVMSVFTCEEMRKANEATVQLLKCRNGHVIEEPIRVFCDGRSGLFGKAVFDLAKSKPLKQDEFEEIEKTLMSTNDNEWDDIFGDGDSDGIF